MSSKTNTTFEPTDTGKLQIHVISAIDHFPIAQAKIAITYTGVPDSTLHELTTDSSGQTEVIDLATPPLEYSMDPNNDYQPYAEYTLHVSAADYEAVTISGVEILPSVTSIQNIALRRITTTDNPEETIAIPAHTLYAKYPPKIPEEDIKEIHDSGEIVLSRVVIPEFIVVHDGSPKDSTAQNYYVKYKDYIKNVASSEIYATWPKATIRANVLAIMSFTLNRVYTEWYRNKGYDFTITSSTAYDQKWIPERNVYDSISIIVDELFADYLSRPNVRQPILTQYCDGRHVQCPNWMSQWGSKYLGDQGYSAVEILRYYYGDDIYINTAQEISGIPASWPGYPLQKGSSGQKVKQMQKELRTIAKAYPAIPKIAVDGIFGSETVAAVKKFQSIFGLPPSGIVDYPTWYKISEIYVGVSRIAELS